MVDIFTEKINSTNATLHILQNTERTELMHALDPLSKEEFKRMTNFQTRQIGTDTSDLIRVLPVSLQLSIPHLKKYSVAVQTDLVAAKKFADKAVQSATPNQLANIPFDSDSVGLVSPIPIPLRLHSIDLQSPQAEDSSRKMSARLTSDDLRAEAANILHVEDDEDEEEAELLEDLDNLMGEEEATGSKIETETDGMAGTEQDQSPGLKPRTNRINSEASRRSLAVKHTSEADNDRSLYTRRRKTASKLDKLPAVLIEEQRNPDERRTISLKGLKEVKDYFDKALHEKNGEDLQKDKVHLKNLIKQLDDFIEFNRKNLSKFDRDLLEQKRKLLEKVESRMVDFSDMQTKFYKTINQQETAKRLNEAILDRSQLPAADRETQKPGFQTPRDIKFRAKNSEMTSDSALILQKVLLQHKAGSLKKPAFMMKSSSLLVMINRVYSDYTSIAEKSKKDRKDFPSIPLLVYFYRYLSMQISNKATLQRNFEKVLGSIVNCSAVTACDLFGKFLGITGSFDHKCFEIFIDMLLYWKKTTKSELINKREKDKMMVTWIKMQDLVNYYVGAFVFKDHAKTKETILSSLSNIVKGAGTLQIDFELAMVMVLEIHRATQVPFEQTVYQAADVATAHPDQRRRHDRLRRVRPHHPTPRARLLQAEQVRPQRQVPALLRRRPRHRRVLPQPARLADPLLAGRHPGLQRHPRPVLLAATAQVLRPQLRRPGQKLGPDKAPVQIPSRADEQPRTSGFVR